VIVACAGSAEQPTLSAFFTASRLHDRTALNAVATTEFDPMKQGSVLDFSIQHVSRDNRSKQVTIDADVLLPTHERVKRTYAVTMTQDTQDRWIVTAVTSLSSPPSTPPTRR
jgi:hypothetical protein